MKLNVRNEIIVYRLSYNVWKYCASCIRTFMYFSFDMKIKTRLITFHTKTPYFDISMRFFFFWYFLLFTVFQNVHLEHLVITVPTHVMVVSMKLVIDMKGTVHMDACLDMKHILVNYQVNVGPLSSVFKLFYITYSASILTSINGKVVENKYF